MYPFCEVYSTSEPFVPMAPVSHRRRLVTSISTRLMTPGTVAAVGDTAAVAVVHSRNSPSRASYILIGYQLFRVAGPVTFVPVPASTANSAGTAATGVE